MAVGSEKILFFKVSLPLPIPNLLYIISDSDGARCFKLIVISANFGHIHLQEFSRKGICLQFLHCITVLLNNIGETIYYFIEGIVWKEKIPLHS